MIKKHYLLRPDFNSIKDIEEFINDIVTNGTIEVQISHRNNDTITYRLYTSKGVVIVGMYENKTPFIVTAYPSTDYNPDAKNSEDEKIQRMNAISEDIKRHKKRLGNRIADNPHLFYGTRTDRNNIRTSIPTFTKSKNRNKFSNSKEFVENIKEGDVKRNRKEIANFVAELEQKTPIKVLLVSDYRALPNEHPARVKIENGEEVKGWYDIGKKRISIYSPHNYTYNDVMRTALHQAIGHYGLRQLLGKHFDGFIADTYRGLSDSERAKVNAMSKQHGWRVDIATEEYLASMAEDAQWLATPPSVWSRIKESVRGALRKAGITGPLNDNAIRS